MKTYDTAEEVKAELVRRGVWRGVERTKKPLGLRGWIWEVVSRRCRWVMQIIFSK